MTEKEYQSAWRKIRGFRRSKRGLRRAELAMARHDRVLSPEEAAELSELEAIDDALERPIWDDRNAFMDEKMAEQGLAWNSDRTEIVWIETGEKL